MDPTERAAALKRLRTQSSPLPALAKRLQQTPITHGGANDGNRH